MYTSAFGLKEKPFSITPNPDYLYLGSRHREALAHLVYGVRERAGFVQLTGEVGTGKTLLTRALLDRVPAHVDVALVYRPGGTVADFVIAILRELGVELPPRRYSVRALVDRLNEHLLRTHARGRTTVLLIDEAQNLQPDLIEQLRLLTNLETASEKLLQIVLVGQPELDRLLRRPDLRQVSQRIAARYHLLPLTRAETAAYVRHRLRVAGASGDLFTVAALFWLHQLSGGVPRLVNLIADRALLGAWSAGRSRVTWREVRRAGREISGRLGRRRAWPVAAAGTAAGLALALALWLPLWQDADAGSDRRPPASGERLDSRLLTTDTEAGLDRAFAGLTELWDAGRLPPEQPHCEAASSLGLRCHYGRDGWQGLIPLGRPAIVELTDRAGTRRPVLLKSLTGDTVLLEIGGDNLSVPRTVFDRHWTGDYLTLWRPLGLSPLPAAPGDTGSAVIWLRERLGGLASSDPDRFDPALAERLRRYQRERGLPVTGELDERTLLHLQASVPTPGPVLRAQGNQG
jgi:general secretion pathway protein A